MFVLKFYPSTSLHVNRMIKLIWSSLLLTQVMGSALAQDRDKAEGSEYVIEAVLLLGHFIVILYWLIAYARLFPKCKKQNGSRSGYKGLQNKTMPVFNSFGDKTILALGNVVKSNDTDRENDSMVEDLERLNSDQIPRKKSLHHIS
jgi:hypothetical protein